jgi:hypothetical protein
MAAARPPHLLVADQPTSGRRCGGTALMPTRSALLFRLWPTGTAPMVDMGMSADIRPTS